MQYAVAKAYVFLYPSLGTASLDLGSAEYCSSQRIFSAEFLCMATKMGSLFPSSLLDGLALCCSSSDTAMWFPDLNASQSGEISALCKVEDL